MTILYGIGGLVLFVIAIVVLYFLSIGVGSIIPVNKKYRPAKDGVPIFLSTNGIHIDFILPMVSEEYDWTSLLQSEPYAKPLKDYQYIAIGCGDRHFYLELDTWAELTVKIAAKAMLIPTPMIMHVIGRDVLPQDQKVRKIEITRDQYAELCQFIEQSFLLDKDEGVQLIPDKGYTPDDNFYQAQGVYHALYTCNYWVNKGLKKIGVRTPLWSPVDRGVFYQIEKVTGKVMPPEMFATEEPQPEPNPAL